MSNVLNEVLAANKVYANTFGEKKNLHWQPHRKFAILTCMDSRMDPAKFAGLVEGDAHVIRNAGGRVSDDAIRSLVVSYKLLGTKEWFVIQHFGCGMSTLTDDTIHNLLTNSLGQSSRDDYGNWYNVENMPGSAEGQFINWLTIKDPVQTLVTDVLRLRNHPLVPKIIPIYGYMFDIQTGQLVEIPEATKIGKPSVG